MSHAEKCPICNGKGKISEKYGGEWLTGPFNKLRKCHGCNGSGWITVQDQCFIPKTDKHSKN